MRYILASVFLAFYFTSAAQVAPCGFDETEEHVARTRELIEMQMSVEGQLGYNSIPVTFHFLHKEDSTGAYTAGMEDSLLVRLNRDFDASRLKFYSCGAARHIYNDVFYDYDASEFTDLLWESYARNTLNIYLFGSVGGGWLCGVYQGNHSVMVAYPCATDAASITHEIGHYLGLLHTFGPTSRTKELADGSNCETEGDLICDTPADPNRAELINSDCIYHGTVEDSLGYPDTIRDANGDPYDPDVHNIMSYYGFFQCRDRFSQQQSDLMNAQLELLMKTHYDCGDIFADFSIRHGESTCETQEVFLEANTSDPLLMYRWDINDDGIVDYNTPTVYHVYDQPGRYTIALEVYDPASEHSVFRTIHEVVELADGVIAGPFSIDFNDGLEHDYILGRNAGIYGWQEFTLVDGNKVAYDIIEYGTPDELIFNVDLAAMEHPVLEFRYAYHYGAAPGDTLDVSVDDCANGFVQLFERGGTSLHTLDSEGHPVDSSEWSYVSIDLAEYIAGKTRIRFRTRGDVAYYVPLFLDDVVVRDEVSSSVYRPLEQSFDLDVWPNPASEVLHLKSTSPIDAYAVTNCWGITVSEGGPSDNIDLAGMAPGVYFVTVRSGDGVISRKFVKGS